jgi:hypothetical protein
LINLITLENVKYRVFIGSNGPCEVSVNIGGKIFRSHHDEINRGLIETSLKRALKSSLERSSGTNSKLSYQIKFECNL